MTKEIQESRIKAYELGLINLLGEGYLFEIPDYQRPFVWETKNFGQLFDDIKQAVSDNEQQYKNLDYYEPYFIGSMVMQTKDKGKYDVIDGQQRLISLAVLIAVMRDLLIDIKKNDDLANILQEMIYQKKNENRGTRESVRIKLRDRETDFFQEYVLNEQGTYKAFEKFLSKTNKSRQDRRKLLESQQKIIEAIDLFRSRFYKNNRLNDSFLISYARYTIRKLIVVFVKTDDLMSAFRLFNTLNARGVDLTASDMLRSLNLKDLEKKEERKKYAELWENIETEIGQEALESLIGFIRSIKVKRREKSILEDFQNIIFNNEPSFKGKRFFDYLISTKETYVEKILQSGIVTENTEEETYYYNLISIMRDYLDFDEWMAALIAFAEKFADSELFEFLKVLERRIFVDWIIGKSNEERFRFVYSIIDEIENTKNASEILNKPIFNSQIREAHNQFVSRLDEVNFYKRNHYKVAKYTLLRLDMEKHDNTNTKKLYTGTITTEHILPKKPTNIYWTERFTPKQQEEWTDKLGNLTLLNAPKNTKAGNKPFPEKLKQYFKNKSDFLITNELENYKEWNMHLLKKRQESLKDECCKIWIEPALYI
jgi:uncharacterized protein with ParB-like and HNH nuclease domain